MFEHGAGDRDSVVEKLSGTARVVALIAFGLLPILCIPYVAAAPVGYTKILVATVGALFSVIFFAFATLRQGSLGFRIELPLIALWGTFAVALVSALFSGDFLDAFWGTEVGPHSAVFAGVLALTATLWAFIGKNKETAVRLYLMLAGSAFVLAIFHLARLFFGNNFLGLGLFGGGSTLSPFGEWNSVAIFFGLMVILSLVALEQLSLRPLGKAFFAAVVAVSLAMLAVINFVAVFVVLAIVGLVMVIYTLTRGKFRPGQLITRTTSSVSVAMSLATLIVSIIFVIGGATLGAWVSNMTGISYIEVRPSLSATFGIAKEVYKDNFLLGIGPNRFADAWRMHHDPGINTTIFWNTNFQSGYGFIPTIIVTEGLLGTIAWLIFLGSLLYIGITTLTRTHDSDRAWYFVAMSSFVASVYLWGMSLVYVPGPVLLLLAALTTGVFLAARRTLVPQSERTVELMRNPRVAFLTVSATVLVVVASVGSMYYVGRHYTASFVYRDALVALAQGGSPEAAVTGIARAYTIAPDDLYARQVALYQGDRIATILASGDTSEQARAEFEQALQSGIQAASLARDVDSTDPETWATLGRMYATVVPLNVEGAYNFAKESFERARDLDPKNPVRQLTLAQLELMNGNTDGARMLIGEAVKLKPNYTDAMFVLAQLEIAAGNVPAAIDSTRAAAMLDPQNPVRFFQLGVLELSANRVDDAIRSFGNAIALSPDYSNARYFLALALDAKGQKEAAADQLQQVLALNPDSAEVKALLDRLASGQSISQMTDESLPEQSETSEGDGSVTSGSAPDSSLLSPVNTDTVPPSDE